MEVRIHWMNSGVLKYCPVSDDVYIVGDECNTDGSMSSSITANTKIGTAVYAKLYN